MASNKIICPACHSEIGPDGKALHRRSGYLDDLEKAADALKKIEKRLADLEDEREKEAQKNAVESVQKKSEHKSWFKRG